MPMQRTLHRAALALLLALPLAACDGMNRTQQRALSGGAIGAAGGAAVGAVTGTSLVTGAAVGAAAGAAIGALTTPSGGNGYNGPPGRARGHYR